MLEPRQTANAAPDEPAPSAPARTEEEALRLPLMRNGTTDLFGFDDDEFDEPKPGRRLSRRWMAVIAVVVIVALIVGGVLVGRGFNSAKPVTYQYGTVRTGALALTVSGTGPVSTALEQRHNIAPGGTDDFTVRSPTQFVQTAQQSTQTLATLLIGIAAISLIVGGIGIMNIMLVSVTERTREIGIRMAVGARRSDIRNQFLIEALTLSAVGGLLGIAIGLVAGLMLTRAFALPFVFSAVAIALAVGVSMLIGVIFGFYPAMRASRIDPIVALRVE